MINFNPEQPHQWMVYSLIRSFQPKLCLELGTGTGYTTACMAKAMEDNHRHSPYVMTVEINGEFLMKAKEQWKTLGIKDEVEAYLGSSPECLNDIARPYDFVFLDQEPKGAYVPALKKLLTFVADDCLFYAHDTNCGHGGNCIFPVLEEHGLQFVEVEPFVPQKFTGGTVFRRCKKKK